MSRPGTKAALADLRAVSAELYDLGRAIEVLGWDQETMMPERGVGPRSEQTATLSGIHHERLTAPKVGELLRELADAEIDPGSGLADDERGLIRQTRHDHDRAVRIPLQLVKDLAQATSQGQATWQRARAESSWALFRDDLARILDLKRQVAEHIGYRTTPYDALLDEYEQGATEAQLTELFGRLRRETVDLLGRIRGSRRKVERSILEREYDVEKQWAFGLDALRWIGFELDAGRIDRSTHPFCAHFSATDVRLTTRSSPTDLAMLLFGNLHEGGHGMYEQGIGEHIRRTAIGSGVSLGIHESQSRMWENFVGRGRAFWEFAFPRLWSTFPGQLQDVSVEDFWRAVNVVAPTPIRVEADEVTYNLHIILRFEVERDLFAGRVKVDDLPEAWNEKTRELLGFTPKNDAEGVLQDIHWAFGLIGYFPTYTLGNVYAAQLWEAIGRDLPTRDALIGRGDFGPLLGWLRDRIHRHGGTYLPNELMRRATGAEPDAKHLTRYLNEKYAAVYDL